MTPVDPLFPIPAAHQESVKTGVSATRRIHPKQIRLLVQVDIAGRQDRHPAGRACLIPQFSLFTDAHHHQQLALGGHSLLAVDLQHQCPIWAAVSVPVAAARVFFVQHRAATQHGQHRRQPVWLRQPLLDPARIVAPELGAVRHRFGRRLFGRRLFGGCRGFRRRRGFWAGGWGSDRWNGQNFISVEHQTRPHRLRIGSPQQIGADPQFLSDAVPGLACLHLVRLNSSCFLACSLLRHCGRRHCGRRHCGRRHCGRQFAGRSWQHKCFADDQPAALTHSPRVGGLQRLNRNPSARRQVGPRIARTDLIGGARGLCDKAVCGRPQQQAGHRQPQHSGPLNAAPAGCPLRLRIGLNHPGFCFLDDALCCRQRASQLAALTDMQYLESAGQPGSSSGPV